MRDIISFAKELGFAPEHTEVFAEAERAIRAAGGDTVFLDAVDAYLSKSIRDVKEAILPLEKLGSACGISEYTVAALFVLHGFLGQKDDYIAAFGEEVFYDSARDLRYKVCECVGTEGVVGTISLGWYQLFLRRELFALGRLQFHTVSFVFPDIEIGGRLLKTGDTVIKTHIPSSGRLTAADCLDAYRRAYRFFRHRFPSDILPIFCASWLLDPEIAAAMPEGGIAQFASHFHIFDVVDDESDHDLWRIFGKRYEDLSILPRESRLQRLIADRLQSGGHIRSGRGVFFFDGENILK